jgi:hypothetical protein
VRGKRREKVNVERRGKRMKTMKRRQSKPRPITRARRTEPGEAGEEEEAKYGRPPDDDDDDDDDAGAPSFPCSTSAKDVAELSRV